MFLVGLREELDGPMEGFLVRSTPHLLQFGVGDSGESGSEQLLFLPELAGSVWQLAFELESACCRRILEELDYDDLCACVGELISKIFQSSLFYFALFNLL